MRPVHTSTVPQLNMRQRKKLQKCNVFCSEFDASHQNGICWLKKRLKLAIECMECTFSYSGANQFFNSIFVSYTTIDLIRERMLRVHGEQQHVSNRIRILRKQKNKSNHCLLRIDRIGSTLLFLRPYASCVGRFGSISHLSLLPLTWQCQQRRRRFRYFHFNIISHSYSYGTCS